MPRPANNDPAVLLERANKERLRWKKAQESYLERAENKEKHKEAVNNYYQANKERLKAAANERNAKKREAAKPPAAEPVVVEPPKEEVKPVVEPVAPVVEPPKEEVKPSSLIAPGPLDAHRGTGKKTQQKEKPKKKCFYCDKMFVSPTVHIVSQHREKLNYDRTHNQPLPPGFNHYTHKTAEPPKEEVKPVVEPPKPVEKPPKNEIVQTAPTAPALAGKHKCETCGKMYKNLEEHISKTHRKIKLVFNGDKLTLKDSEGKILNDDNGKPIANRSTDYDGDFDEWFLPKIKGIEWTTKKAFKNWIAEFETA